MDDYISREKALQFRLSVNASREANRMTVARGVANAIAEYIKAIPAADVRPVPRGEWQEGEFKYLTCSVCGCDTCLYDLHGFPIGQSTEFNKPQFCPHCGADMRGEQDA